MTTFEVARAEALALNRAALLGATLGLLFSANAVLVLTYGLVGVPGNSLFTGVYLAGCEAAILLIAFRRVILLPADYLFGAFVLCIATSFAINGRTADIKESILLVLALASYPVCRFVSHSALDEINNGFSVTTATIVIIGAIVTLYAIIDQWPVPRGKPLLFGFDASTNFLGALGFVILAVAAKPLAPLRRAVYCAVLLMCTAIFAAALVRFVFIALVCSLLLAAALSAGRQRLHVVIIIFGVLASIAAGLWVRYDTAKVLMSYATQETKASLTPKHSIAAAGGTQIERLSPPSCSLDPNQNNSIAVRKVLLLDALYLIPKAGMFGFGFDSFVSITCIAGHQAHNSLVQAIVEFGWLGGLSLALLVGVAGWRLLPPARKDDNARFILCSLAYVTIISLAHGRISHDLWFFGLLGLAAGIYETKR